MPVSRSDRGDHGAVGTLSTRDYLRATNRLILRGGDPEWLPIDLTAKT